MKWKFFYYSSRVEKDILGMPYTRAMGDSLFEMRISGKDNIARIFYGTVIAGEIFILHSFIKKTQKTPTHELKLAKKRLKEVQHHG